MNGGGTAGFFGVLWVPWFRLQAALRQAQLHPVAGSRSGLNPGLNPGPASLPASARPAALVSGRPPRVLECNAPAAGAGVRSGMSLPEATVQCPELHWVAHCEAAEAGASALLRETAFLLSPWVEETAPGTCTVFCSGPARSAALGMLEETLLPHLRRLGLEVVAGLGPNPGIALLAAHAAGLGNRSRRVWSVETAETFADLPLEHGMAAEPGLAALLELWGLRRMGDLAALNRGDCVERLGPAAGTLWDLAAGNAWRPLRCCRPPESFRETVDFEDARVETLEPLLFVLRQMLLSLVRRLENLWLAVAELELTLRLENAPALHRRFSLPAASSEPALLLRVLQTHLEGVRTGRPVTGLSLEIFPSRPPRQQLDLLNRGLRDPNQFFETLARLHTVLGIGRVGVPELEPTHRPDQFKLAPPGLRTDPSAPELPPCSAPVPPRESLEAVPCGMGLRRFRPPVPAEVRVDPVETRPLEVRSAVVEGLVRASRGPWHGSGEWWAECAWDRREWDVQLASGQLCRVCQENGAWQLEGIYD